jgi:hypothetical protein
MSAISGPHAFRFAAVVVLAVLASGCAGHTTTSSAPAPSTAASTATPTPMTAAELAWVMAVTKLHKKIDKPFMAGSLNMTRATMIELGNRLRACNRELQTIGPPSDRLQPVYVLVQKACRIYAKGARCFARAVSVSDAAGATIAGTPQARTQRRSLSCAFAAQGNGSNLFGQAEVKAAAITAQFS